MVHGPPLPRAARSAHIGHMHATPNLGMRVAPNLGAHTMPTLGVCIASGVHTYVIGRILACIWDALP